MKSGGIPKGAGDYTGEPVPDPMGPGPVDPWIEEAFGDYKAIPRKKCKHNFDFKYKTEEVTENGKIIIKEHYFCKRCLEEKVVEK